MSHQQLHQLHLGGQRDRRRVRDGKIRQGLPVPPIPTCPQQAAAWRGSQPSSSLASMPARCSSSSSAAST